MSQDDQYNPLPSLMIVTPTPMLLPIFTQAEGVTYIYWFRATQTGGELEIEE